MGTPDNHATWVCKICGAWRYVMPTRHIWCSFCIDLWLRDLLRYSGDRPEAVYDPGATTVEQSPV